MVNLVVRHSSGYLQGGTLQRSQSPALTKRNASPKPKQTVASTPASGFPERGIPSPIRVPYRPRPLSPLTTSESMFGGVSVVVRDPREQDPALSHDNESDSREQQQVSDALPLVREDGTKGGDLICDYDTSVSPLYELLESSQWDKARIRCRTNPKEVRTWIVRRDQKTGKVRWKLLPLHAAVIFQAPTDVVTSMLEGYPIAAAKRDDQGMLPLHLAFRHKQREETLLELLLEQFPQGVTIKDRRNRLPLEHGKETQFSTKLMQMYAEAHGKGSTDGPDATSELKNSCESQMETLKSVYEERLATMAREHKQALEDLQRAVEQDQRVVITQHHQETDELRDLLSREVGGGQRVGQLEMEIEDLKVQVEQSNQETEMLRSVLQDQKAYQEELKCQLGKVLSDQKTLHSFCMQQQQQLDEDQRVRQQLYRTLMQNEEDSKPMRMASDICQVSDNVQMRMEKILSQVTPGVEEEVVETVDVTDIVIDDDDNLVIDDHHIVGDFVEETQRHEHAHEEEEEEVEDWRTEQHDDEISAITDLSNF